MSNGMNSEKKSLWAERWVPIVIDVEGVETHPVMKYQTLVV